jgi:hypothetical protein
MAVGGPAVSSTAMTGWAGGSLAMMVGINQKPLFEKSGWAQIKKVFLLRGRLAFFFRKRSAYFITSS